MESISRRFYVPRNAVADLARGRMTAAFDSLVKNFSPSDLKDLRGRWIEVAVRDDRNFEEGT